MPNAGDRHDLRLPDADRPRRQDAPLAAGTIVGSGTVSNTTDGGPGKPIAEGGAGYSCIAEMRTVETILDGKPKTPFMHVRRPRAHRDAGRAGHSIFGAIEQKVVRHERP